MTVINQIAKPILTGVLSPILGGNPLAPILNLNPTLFLDASVASSITTATGVSQWDDLSGNGRHVVQATGSAQPQTGVNTMNGLNVLTFNGTSQFLHRDSFLYAQGAMALFAVITHSGDTDRRFVCERNDSDSSSFYAFGSGESLGDESRVFVRNDNNTVQISQTGSSSPFDTNPVSMRYEDTGSNMATYVNNTLDISGAYTRGTLNVTDLGIGAAFRDGFAAASFLDGDIATIITFDYIPDTAELAIINSFLSKWGTF